MSSPYSQYPTPYPPPGPPAKVGKSKWYRRAWVLPAAVVLVALLIGVGIGSSTAKTKDVAGPTVTATATVAGPTVTATVTTTPTRVVATRTVQVRVTYTPAPVDAFSDGTYVIGTDIPAGIYKTTDADGSPCYWARLSDLTGGINSISANDNITGPTTVQILTTDKAFTVTGGCNWSRVG